MASRPRRIEWRKVGEVVLVFTVLPTIAFYLLGLRWPIVLIVAYYSVVSLFVLMAAWFYLDSIGGIVSRRFHELPSAQGQPVPKTTFIVSAYLPNELEVIETTLLHVLHDVERPADGIEVILAYNTPELTGLEPRLNALAREFPELILANTYDSRSKSENLNYALGLASGQMIVLLDADALVATDSLWRAWRWLDEGYDAVQGRCVIRNGDKPGPPRLVAVEFEYMYGISHPSKSLLFDTALFGGSNGFWRASCLKTLGFRTDRLTEDIDLTLRALLSGRRIVHDRSIVSTEEAPETWGTLWFQRKRWSQGWFQCSLAYQWSVLRSKYLTFRNRLLWGRLLMWRVFYDIVSQFLFPNLIAFWLLQDKVTFPMNGYIWFALIFTLASGPFEAAAAFRNAVRPRGPIRRYLYYGLMAFPYTLFKTLVNSAAVLDELRGHREWVVSPRAQRAA